MSEPTTLTVFTIGYGNASETKFLELLKVNGIELVIDVRQIPYSRFAPQFNRENLKALLGGRRIGYVFMGDTLTERLPRDSDGLYRAPELDKRTEFSRTSYLEDLVFSTAVKRDEVQSGIEQAMKLAAEQRVAFMSGEENPAGCHRHHLIARALFARGVAVHHIRHSGAVEVASIDDFVQQEFLPFA